MGLSALVLFCCTALPAHSPSGLRDTPAWLPATQVLRNPCPLRSRSSPDVPEPKGTDVSTEGIGPGSQPFSNSPIKPAVDRPVESPRQRKIWYSLFVAGHSAATFDAWSTRRAISGGYRTGGDPLLRPFCKFGSNVCRHTESRLTGHHGLCRAPHDDQQSRNAAAFLVGAAGCRRQLLLWRWDSQLPSCALDFASNPAVPKCLQ